EGVFIIKGPEYYYIFASRGRCCAGMESTYQIVMGRSKNVTGPYLNKERVGWIITTPYFLQATAPHRAKGITAFLPKEIQPSSCIMLIPVQPMAHRC
ncbi:MAG: family 43 glycosylhydrolase, partial [Flavisolibacter sp.]|nr:family 43 glycosylhydrolase [Flavisolibacter sp.]